MIRLFREADGPEVDKVYSACHPRWPKKPEGWWWAHPTLVLETQEDGLIGATSFVVGLPPAPDLAALVQMVQHHKAEVGWGHGVYVKPHQRGNGYGWDLAQARHKMLASLGVHFFFGMTQPDNHAMMAIFMKQQLTRSVTVPNTYPDGRPGVLYHGGIV